MPPSSRQIHTANRLASSQASSSNPQHLPATPARGVLLIGAALAAGASWLIVRWLASQFHMTPGVAGIAAFSAAWTALYPFARLNRVSSPWSHWARGTLVLIVFWMLTMFSR
jgi:hypothetical protein